MLNSVLLGGDHDDNDDNDDVVVVVAFGVAVIAVASMSQSEYCFLLPAPGLPC